MLSYIPGAAGLELAPHIAAGAFAALYYCLYGLYLNRILPGCSRILPGCLILPFCPSTSDSRHHAPPICSRAIVATTRHRSHTASGTAWSCKVAALGWPTRCPSNRPDPIRHGFLMVGHGLLMVGHGLPAVYPRFTHGLLTASQSRPDYCGDGFPMHRRRRPVRRGLSTIPTNCSDDS